MKRPSFLTRLFTSDSKKKKPFAEHHNLKEIFHEINTHYFAGELSLSIQWFGREPSAHLVRKKILGYYSDTKKSIKIHRSLNSPHIPSFFIAYIVYHEMLHSVEPPYVVRGRRSVHHARFKVKERAFIDYEKAKAWQKDNLSLILNGR